MASAKVAQKADPNGSQGSLIRRLSCSRDVDAAIVSQAALKSDWMYMLIGCGIRCKWRNREKEEKKNREKVSVRTWTTKGDSH